MQFLTECLLARGCHHTQAVVGRMEGLKTVKTRAKRAGQLYTGGKDGTWNRWSTNLHALKAGSGVQCWVRYVQ